MSYIWKNIKTFFRNETGVFFLVAICIFSSAIMANFAVGFFYHIDQTRIDEASGSTALNYMFHDETRTEVSKGRVMEMLTLIDAETLNDCEISLAGRFLDEVTDNWVMDRLPLSIPMIFSIIDGKVTVSIFADIYEERLLDGREFTAEEIENSELVCIAFPESTEEYHYGIVVDGDEDGVETAYYMEKYAPNEDGKYIIGGKEYTCIGHNEDYYFIPAVPVTTVDDDVYIRQLSFFFKDRYVTKSEYRAINEWVWSYFGDLAEYPELELPEVDMLRFYNTLLVFCVLLVGMAGVVLAMLYQFILLQRRRELTVFRICGLGKRKAAWIYFGECFLLSLLFYLLAFAFYMLVLLPHLSKTFRYIAVPCTVGNCLLLGVLYLTIISVIQYIMIRKQLKQSVLVELREV